MAERDATTSQQMSAIERRRARSRSRYAILVAADPEYHKNKYRRHIELHPNSNRDRYAMAIANDPDFNRKKRKRAKLRRIAKGEKLPERKTDPLAARQSKSERDRIRYQKNKKSYIERVVRRQKERYSTDQSYVVYQSLRSRMRYAVKSQTARRCLRNIELIGCSPMELVAHLESQFLDGMSWSNRSEWHIDHIIPVSAFDLTTKEGQRAAFHYTNLRPLWAIDNRRKSAKPPGRQRRFAFGYVMLADEQKKPGTARRLGTERRRA